MRADRLQAVLWDLDGTLIDSQPLWDEAFRSCCRALGGRPTPEAVAAIRGVSIRRVHELIAATGATSGPEDPATAQVFAAMAADVGAAVRADPPLLPGAREATSAAAGAGLVQVIVTQSPRGIVEAVAHALGDVFAALVTGDDVASGKPSPAPYAAAVQRLGLGPGSAWWWRTRPPAWPRPAPTTSASSRSAGPRCSPPTPVSPWWGT